MTNTEQVILSNYDKKNRVTTLKSWILCCDKYKTRLAELGKDRTAKYKALNDLMNQYIEEKLALEYELLTVEIDSFLSNIGGIRVAD